MSDIQNNIENSKEEITLKELILKIKEYIREIKRHWLTVAVCCSLVSSYMLYEYYKTPFTYTATLTFMVNTSEGGGGLAGAASILSSLGVAGPEKDNLDKILALSQSMRIINESILKRVKVDGKEDYIANHIIDKYDFINTTWKKSTKLQGFMFKHSNIDSFSLIEKSAVKSIFAKIVGLNGQEALMLNSHARQTQIMTMKITTVSDELSIVLSESIFKTLSDFYIKKTVEREEETFKVVKSKVDSIKRALLGSEYASAKFDDTNRGLFMETVKVPIKQLNRDVNRLTLMYGEAVKNLELSDFALKNKRPYVQPIDMPFSPLVPSDNSWKKAIALGLVLGLIVASFLISVRKLARDVLK